MIVVIGNGKSRSVFDLQNLNKHITYGCNAIHREYTPTYLICGDGPMTWEICASGYSTKNKCYFKCFDKLPSFNYDMIRMIFPPGMKILENEPQTNEFVSLGSHGRALFYWVAEDEQSEGLEWWDDERYNTGTAAMRLACLMNPNQDIYCLGFDYYLDRTADNIFLGTPNYSKALEDIGEKENQMMLKWLEQHGRIEEEFDNKIYHVGKHMNYIEFENLLNK